MPEEGMMVTMADDAPADVPAGSEGGVVVWRAIGRGAVVALVLLVTLSVAEAIVDRNVTDFNDSGWIYPFFVGVLASYAAGGWVAGRTARDAALTNGALAGVFGFVMWIPVRIAIWAVRDEHKGLFTGHAPVLRLGQIFGHLVIAAALGMLGGWIGSRVQRRATASRTGAAS
jgi:hypothetical protein